MALSISEKGKRIVQLIKAVKAAGALVSGDKVLMPDERPAAYIGPVMEEGITGMPEDDDTNYTTTGLAIICECGCSRDVPAPGPWFLNSVTSSTRGSATAAR